MSLFDSVETIRDVQFNHVQREDVAVAFRDPMPLSVRHELARMPGVARTMARLNFSGLLNNGKVDLPILGEGVEPGSEAVLARSITILAGRALAERDRSGILIGEGLAATLKLKPGDPVTKRYLGEHSRITGFATVEDSAYDSVRLIEKYLDSPRADVKKSPR